MAHYKVAAARAQTASLRPATTLLTPRVAARGHSAGVVRTCVFAPNTAPKEEQTNLLDMALNAVLSLFQDQQQQSASEELQLPPELKAYLEELEAQEHGGHSGGWVHSGIAERLSSSDDFSGLE